jgi:hypothetical protein
MKVPASVPDPAIRLLCADAAAVSFAPGFSPVSAIASKRKTVSKVSSPLLKGIETVCGAFDHVITPLKRDADERTHPSCHTEPGSFRRTRRDFLSLCLRASGLAALGDAGAAPASRRSSDLIDVNVSLSRWPFRRLRFDDTEALVAKLRRHRVTQAWAGSFEGLLHKDLAAVNARLASECRHHGRGILVPFGSINPNLPDWEEELRRCTEEHRMPGIRLHPNYHGYRLDDPSFARLLRLAAERRLLVQLALVLEDERMMHRLVRVEPVDAAPLADLVRRTPGLRLVLLNALRTLHDQPLLDLIAAGEVYVEISMLEGVGGIGNLVAQVPAHRVLFGSHAPLFYFESAQLKLKESPLGEQQLRAIRNGNAAALLAQR